MPVPVGVEEQVGNQDAQDDDDSNQGDGRDLPGTIIVDRRVRIIMWKILHGDA